MKVRLIGFVGILVIVAALIAAPVSAGSTTGTSAVTGNPSSYASITLNETTVVLGPGGIMPPGASSSNQSLGINVTCNEHYTITVADNTERIAAEQGYMGNYTSTWATPSYGNATVSGLNTTLTAPIQEAGTTNATASVTGSTITPPITTGSTLYSSTQPSNNLILAPNTFTQPVNIS